MPHIDLRGEVANGAIYSNVTDLARSIGIMEGWRSGVRRWQMQPALAPRGGRVGSDRNKG
jgi:hypothetical protein